MKAQLKRECMAAARERERLIKIARMKEERPPVRIKPVIASLLAFMMEPDLSELFMRRKP